MKRIICTFLAVFLLVLGCAGCQPTGGNDPTPEPIPTPTPIPDDPKPDDEPTVQSPEQLLAAMTLEEKLGSCLLSGRNRWTPHWPRSRYTAPGTTACRP